MGLQQRIGTKLLGTWSQCPLEARNSILAEKVGLPRTLLAVFDGVPRLGTMILLRH
jgi:hypothetical protein